MPLARRLQAGSASRLCVRAGETLTSQLLYPDCPEDALEDRIMEGSAGFRTNCCSTLFHAFNVEEKLERPRQPAHRTRMVLLRWVFKMCPPPLPLSSDSMFSSAWQMRWPTFYWRALACLPAPQSTSAHVDPGFTLLSSFFPSCPLYG